MMVLTPSRFFTLSLYLTNTTLDEWMLSFSPAHNNCRHVARSRKSTIFSSRSNSRWFSLLSGLDGQIYKQLKISTHYKINLHWWLG